MKLLSRISLLFLMLAGVSMLFACRKETPDVPHVHTWGEWITTQNATCTDAGTQERNCSCGQKENRVIPAASHTVRFNAMVPATCMSTGLTEGSYCSSCGEILSRQQTIEKLPHTEVVAPAVAATCVATGLSEGKYCKECSTILIEQKEIPALGHTEVVEPEVAATCTEVGRTEEMICSVCEAVLVAAEEIPALGHIEVVEPAVAATCTETGKTEGKICSVCNEVLVASEIVEALGHEFVVGRCECGAVQESGPRFIVSEGIANAGEIVEITVALENNPGIASMILEITFDSAVMSLNEVIYNQDIGGQTIPPQTYDSPVRLYWISGLADVEGDWIFATLKFNIRQDAAAGVYGITLTYNADDVYDITETNLPFDTVNGKITVNGAQATEPFFAVSSSTVEAGDSVDVMVSLQNNPGIASAILTLAYDADVFELAEVIYNTDIGGQTVQPQMMNSPVRLYWINGFANAEGDFVLATMRFNVKNEVAQGDYDITLSYEADDVYDISEKNLPFEVVNGKITIIQ